MPRRTSGAAISDETAFLAMTVKELKRIRNNPTPAKIDDLLIQMQAWAMQM